MKIDKQIIQVPSDIRYLSDWTDFDLNNFPNKCIIDKQIPGCGFTEYCLNSSDNLILCSPRIMLMKNKYNQHEKEEKGSIFIIYNETSTLDIDSDSTKKSSKIDKLVKEEDNQTKYQNIFKSLKEYCINRSNLNKPCKIIVTYDSYYLVLGILSKLNLINTFKTVIDEFQSILHDSRFKSSTELEFLEYLKVSPTAYFVSATPMLDEYVKMLNEFKDLPYFELDWNSLQPGRVIMPNISKIFMKSVTQSLREVIKEYLDGNFEVADVVLPDKSIKRIMSTEAVLYVNSVSHIISIIKKMKLSPEQVNILCSNTEDNKKKIKSKLGESFDIGEVPLKGDYHKMFTFCTRTVYLGADFYSPCARTFIFSDANLDCLAVDISEDLPQILGRQRSDENPWKNCATLYYRTIVKNISPDEFKDEIARKMTNTKNLIDVFYQSNESIQKTLANTYLDLVRLKKYKDDYVSINRIEGGSYSYKLNPVFNNLVYVSEIRAFKIAQIDYKDRVAVLSNVSNKFNSNLGSDKINKTLKDYYDASNISSKLKILCSDSLSKDELDIILNCIPDSDKIKSYVKFLGTEKIKDLYFNSYLIRSAYDIKTYTNIEMDKEIFEHELFKFGNKIDSKSIKDIFSEIYKKYNCPISPKATNILLYFRVKPILVLVNKDSKNKRVSGYEILGYNGFSINYTNYLYSKK